MLLYDKKRGLNGEKVGRKKIKKERKKRERDWRKKKRGRRREIGEKEGEEGRLINGMALRARCVLGSLMFKNKRARSAM